MTIKINQDLCAGCGLCMEECPSDAITMSNNWPLIDQERCNGCEICVEICPNGAIEVLEKQSQVEIVPGGQMLQKPAPIQGQVLYPAPVSNRSKLAPIASAALAYMGREVFPRVVDAMVTALENRLARTASHENISLDPTTNAGGLHWIGSKEASINSRRGRGKQTRYRGGRGNFRNRKGRR